jgi:dipeptidyl aminopeptidase/acylaminoacyl peptidase
VVAAHWSPDGRWLAFSVATGGGVKTEVWVVRPDGSGARRLAGNPSHAVLGPWKRTGHRLVVTVTGADGVSASLLVDPGSGTIAGTVAGAVERIAGGPLVQVLDLSPDERFALLREGPRGAQVCRLLDRADGTLHEILPEPRAGETPLAFLRQAPPGDPHRLVAYAVTDAGLPRRALVAAPIGADGVREGAGTIARRDDAEIDYADADDAGRRVLVVWNVEGRSEIEVIDTALGTSLTMPGLPGEVVSGGVLTRDGSLAVLAVESPLAPRRLWALDLGTASWRPLTPAPPLGRRLVAPTLERLESHDGLGISGWLYRPPDADGPTPTVVSVHGGPESQERPVFNPYHQMLAAAGLTVFAPNIRGSSGFGRAFVHADDRYGRLDAIGDVAACAGWLVRSGVADPSRIAVAGRSYGGYATLMCLVLFPETFAAGIDVCGMSDLLTFFRDTEPWIARAAVTKYGDPVRDADLLAHLSPLRHVVRILGGGTPVAPLLVAHGELDTNVPVSESHQIVAALRSAGCDVEYLELPGEGHEVLRAASRQRLLLAMTRFLDRTLRVRNELRSPREPAGVVEALESRPVP